MLFLSTHLRKHGLLSILPQNFERIHLSLKEKEERKGEEAGEERGEGILCGLNQLFYMLKVQIFYS